MLGACTRTLILGSMEWNLHIWHWAFLSPPLPSAFCSLGVCDQMWPYYKFNKDVCVCVCDLGVYVCDFDLWQTLRLSKSATYTADAVCVYLSVWEPRVRFTRTYWSYSWFSPNHLISSLHVSVVNPLVSLGTPPPSSSCPPVTPSSPPPQMGPFISPQNTNNGHWRIPKGLVAPPLIPAAGLNGIMMQVVAKGGKREDPTSKQTTANTNNNFLRGCCKCFPFNSWSAFMATPSLYSSIYY